LALLEVHDLVHDYGSVRALRGIAFDVEAGSCVALLGANGAGKTTTLRAITRLHDPSGGDIRFDGESMLPLDAAQVVRRRVCMVPEGRRVFPGLSVQDNLLLGGFLQHDAKARQERLGWVCDLFPRLDERRGQPAGSLSGGEQQMLAIGRALMWEPRLLLLDEPSMGLAPIIVKHIFATLRQLRESGMTMLVVEQNANLALRLCDEGVVLRSGNVALQGTSDRLRAGDALRAAYLG